MMKRSFLLLAVAAASLAYADDASKSAKVEEFFKLAKMDDMLRQGLALASNQMKSGFTQQLTGVKVPPEREKSMAQFQENITHVLSEALSWDKLKPAYVKLYADAYTEQELDDMVAFYKSPTGQSMVSKTAILMGKATEVVQKRMAEAMPELQKLMRDFAEQAAKKP